MEYAKLAFMLLFLVLFFGLIVFLFENLEIFEIKKDFFEDLLKKVFYLTGSIILICFIVLIIFSTIKAMIFIL